jgi:uncharacterized membrane protein YeaQ/YmgE (transglycosylase-associated protein family)
LILSPAFTFGILIATLYGLLTHLIFGGDGRRLVATIVAGWVGFAIGQAIGQVMDIRVLALGPINLLSASFGALMATTATAFLAAHRNS